MEQKRESALVTTIMADLKDAMKNKDTVRKGVLQLLKAGIVNEGIKLRKELNADEELVVVRRELKQTKDSLAEAQKVGREDVVAQAKAKIAVIEKYLPTQLSAEQIQEQLVTLGITKDMNLGQVMKIVMPVLKDVADGGLIRQAVQSFLTK